MKTAQLVDQDANVQIAVVNNHGKPTTIRMPRAEAIKLAQALLDIFGIGNPEWYPSFPVRE